MWVMPQPKVDLSLLERRQKEGSYETEVYDVRDWHKVGLTLDVQYSHI